VGARVEIQHQRRSFKENRQHSADSAHSQIMGTCSRSSAQATTGCLPTAKTFGFRDNDQCVCGAQGTVTHVLMDCPRLRELRRELRREVGDAFNSMSSLLGGSTEGERRKPDTVSQAKTVNAVLDFAEATLRFRSRAPQG
jgi:hypothetical protein